MLYMMIVIDISIPGNNFVFHFVDKSSVKLIVKRDCLILNIALGTQRCEQTWAFNQTCSHSDSQSYSKKNISH